MHHVNMDCRKNLWSTPPIGRQGLGPLVDFETRARTLGLRGQPSSTFSSSQPGVAIILPPVFAVEVLQVTAGFYAGLESLKSSITQR